MGKKGDLARQKIMDTAIALYSKRGFDQTSFQMIARELNITHTAPIYHFKNKLGLFSAVVERVFNRVDGIVLNTMNTNDPANIQLTKYFQGHMTWTLVFKNEAEVFPLLASFACIKDEFAEIYKDMMAKKRSQILEIIESGRDEGVFNTDVSLEIQGAIMLDALLGMLLFRLAGRNEKRPLNELNLRIDETINSILVRK